ncbi:CoA ester lyase [Leptospira selangorensis]|uniref:CoA ester lyase n=1 Tax=Leptospira selangorensis TaxID=2484982 RepID=A0A4V3JBS8_9LEPT|nr:CoA ester lyase [Leptospira selangorensis]TGK03379.1 CoA ester lyase [Leptospira selangorensis]TGM10803.1 CoA ester lyase [Leptospira selangorensis]TGM26838.1 CoA ester lyase [Leptospira selangorensis]
MSTSLEQTLYRPRRSLLFVPGWKKRYLEKSKELDVDSLIFDWEESVPPQEKENARHLVEETLGSFEFSKRERIIRINHWQSPWFQEDLQTLKKIRPDSVIIPGIQTAEDISFVLEKINSVLPNLPVLVLIEHAKAVLQAESILKTSEQILALVLENNSLSASLKLYPSSEREGLLFSLSHLVLVCRAYQRIVIDGAYLNYTQPETFELHCRQARNLGFDGKTIIHPNQILYANEAFRPKDSEVVRAEKIVSALEQTKREGFAICVVEGHVIEPIEVENANRILSLHRILQNRSEGEIFA